MTDVPQNLIVAVRTEEVAGHPHIIGVKLADGAIKDAADVVAEIEAHDAHYAMKPPEGAPAYQAHQETGLNLLVQTRPCPDCGETVLSA